MIPIPNGLSLKLIIGIVAALMLALLIHDRNRWKAKTEHYAEVISAERNAHQATAANYRAAAEQARRENAENLARVRAEQSTINERTINDFESRIAAARAAAASIDSGRLRGEAGAQADSRGGGAAAVPVLSAPARGTAQAPGQDELSRNPSGTGPAGDPMTFADRLIATEQAIQLDELIKWVRAQSRVDVNRR